jgi:hypothetical protein
VWTNVFFLWPALRAASLLAWSEGFVFSLTLLVSAVHHGCVGDEVERRRLSVDTFTVVGSSVVVLGLGFAISYYFSIRDRLQRAAAVPLLFSVVFFIIGATVAILIPATTTYDACLYAYTDEESEAALLVDIWSTVDFLTAFASLIVVLIYLFQIRHRVELAVFWLFLVVILVGTLYSRAGLASLTSLYAYVVVLAAIIITIRLWLCLTQSDEDRRRFVERYDWCDLVLTVVVGTLAISIFVAYNTASTHGWWHVAAAVALYLGVEAIYKRYSFFVMAMGTGGHHRPTE